MYLVRYVLSYCSASTARRSSAQLNCMAAGPTPTFATMATATSCVASEGAGRCSGAHLRPVYASAGGYPQAGPTVAGLRCVCAAHSESAQLATTPPPSNAHAGACHRCASVRCSVDRCRWRFGLGNGRHMVDRTASCRRSLNNGADRHHPCILLRLHACINCRSALQFLCCGVAAGDALALQSGSQAVGTNGLGQGDER